MHASSIQSAVVCIWLLGGSAISPYGFESLLNKKRKSNSKRHSFFLTGVEGHNRHERLSCLTTASEACSTRLRTNFAKNDYQSLFTLVAPSVFESLLTKKSAPSDDDTDFLTGVEGLEPSRTVLETGMLPLHHTPKEQYIQL